MGAVVHRAAGCKPGITTGFGRLAGLRLRLAAISATYHGPSTMLIFVPPSETKAFPAQAPPVEPGSLALPELTPVRARLLKALVRLARGRAPAALVRTE